MTVRKVKGVVLVAILLGAICAAMHSIPELISSEDFLLEKM